MFESSKSKQQNSFLKFLFLLAFLGGCFYVEDTVFRGTTDEGDIGNEIDSDEGDIGNEIDSDINNATFCGVNEYVNNHICQPCAAGMTNEAGDNASGDNTACYSINNPSGFSSCGSDCPVENVNWWEALAYANALSTSENLQECYVLSDCTNSPGNNMQCNEVSWTSNCFGYRLPTEAEWEYAIRAGTRTAFYNGESTPGNIAWYNSNSNSRTHPVAQLEANLWEIYDMSGNVWEWCWDWYEAYDSLPATDPMGPDSGFLRVLRGGSWRNSASLARSACRHIGGPDYRSNRLGFRLVSSAP